MDKEKRVLTERQEWACWKMRRRRRELARRIKHNLGSEEAKRFNAEEHNAISILLSLIGEMTAQSNATNPEIAD